MKSLRTVRYSLLAAAVAGGALASAPALAEVSASAGVTNIYLWRGFNLGGGTPAVYGGLEAAHDSGVYAGVWGSSAGPTQEIDLYAGFRGGEDFTYNIAYYDYTYPSEETIAANGIDAPSRLDNRSADYEEVIVNLGFKGVTLDIGVGMGDTGGNIVNEDGEEKSETIYAALGYSYEKFFGKVGMWEGLVDDLDADPLTALEDANFTHVDVGYKYNDRLVFTLSKIVEDDDNEEDDTLFQVSYTLPLDVK